jgi:hypothetical protein
MPIVDRPVEDEPEEKPDQLGRHLLRVKAQYPDQWRDVFETSSRQHAVRIEGCLIGRGEGRIAGASDIEHWEARMIERTEDDGKGGSRTVYTVRAKYHSKPHGKDWRAKPRPVKPAETEPTIADTVGTTADHPETARVNPAGRSASGKGADVSTLTNDPDDAAQRGLDMAGG